MCQTQYKGGGGVERAQSEIYHRVSSWIIASSEELYMHPLVVLIWLILLIYQDRIFSGTV